MGITILLKSSTLLTMPVAFIYLSSLQTSRRGQCPHRPAGGHRPVAVPCVRLGDGAPALHTDRGHSLRSLHLPQAALPSLPYNNFTNYAVSIYKHKGFIHTKPMCLYDGKHHKYKQIMCTQKHFPAYSFFVLCMIYLNC